MSIDTSATIGKNVVIDVTAVVKANATIGDNTVIAEYSVVHENAVIGRDVHISSFCLIGEPVNNRDVHTPGGQNTPVYIGDHSRIRSHTIIYSDTRVGSHFQTGHRVLIREKARIGTHVRIGSYSDIEGHCEIGDYVSLHSNVHICTGSVIKNFVWIFPYSILTNDPTPPSMTEKAPVLHEFSVIATRVTLLPGVVVGARAFVGANSLVSRNVLEDELVCGSPAKSMGKTSRLRNAETKKAHYPWMENFDRGMPWKGQDFNTWYSENYPAP